MQVQRRNLNIKSSVLIKQDQIPGCIFSKGRETIPISLPYKEFKECLSKNPSRFPIELGEEQKFLVGLREIQRNPINNSFLHISLQALDQHEKATLKIPVDVKTEDNGKRKDGEISNPIREIMVKGYLSDIPEKIIVDITHLNVGQHIKVSDIESNYSFNFLEEDRNKIIAGRYHIKTISLETKSPSQEDSEETPKEDTKKAA